MVKSNMSKAAVAFGIAAFGFGATAASSSAAPVVQKIGGGSFSGITAVDSGHTFTAGSAVVTCDDGAGGGATFSNVSGTGTNASATFNAAYSDCVIDISGIVCGVSVSTPGTWTLTATGASPATSWGGQASISSTATITVNDPGCGITNCTVTIAAGGPWSGGTATNAGGVLISGTISGIGYSATAGCGIATPGTASYALPSGITIPGIEIVG